MTLIMDKTRKALGRVVFLDKTRKDRGARV